MKTFTKSSLIALIAATMLAGAIAPMARAQDTSYVPLAPLPCIPSPAVAATTDSNGNTVPATPAVTCTGGTGSLETSVDFQTYAQYAFNLLIALAAVAAVFMIVFGGFEYMTSDAIGGKKEGLAKVRHAVEGLLLVLCSYLILRTINPQLVQVPVSLVAPLNLSGSGALSSWAEQLQGQVSKYNLQEESLTNQISSDITTVSSLQTAEQSVAQDIQSYAGSSPQEACSGDITDETLNELCFEWTKDQSQATQIQQTDSLTVAEKGITQLLNTYLSDPTGNTGWTGNTLLTNIDSICAQATNLSTVQQQTCKSQAANAEGTIVLNNAVVGAYAGGDTVESAADQIIHDYLPAMTDPAQKQQLVQQTLKAVTTAITNNQNGQTDQNTLDNLQNQQQYLQSEEQYLQSTSPAPSSATPSTTN